MARVRGELRGLPSLQGKQNRAMRVLVGLFIAFALGIIIGAELGYDAARHRWQSAFQRCDQLLEEAYKHLPRRFHKEL